MLGAAPDDADAVAAWSRDVVVPLQQLRVTEDGVERRAELVAHAHHVAALGEVGGLGRLLGLLQLGVG